MASSDRKGPYLADGGNNSLFRSTQCTEVSAEVSAEVCTEVCTRIPVGFCQEEQVSFNFAEATLQNLTHSIPAAAGFRSTLASSQAFYGFFQRHRVV